MATKTIVLACDHAAVELKKKVISHLEGLGYSTIDVGTHTTESCAYPEYGRYVNTTRCFLYKVSYLPSCIGSYI